MKKVLSVLLVLAMVLCMFACGQEKKDEPAFDPNVKSEGVMTYAEYVAAEKDTEVTVEGFVQLASYNAKYGNLSIYIQDGDGAYYLYRYACDAAKAATFVEGVKVKAHGYKAEWQGEVEIGDIDVLEVVADGGKWVAEAKDVTADMTDDAKLMTVINQKVAIKGVEVIATKLDDKEVAFLYNWDGSGEKGSDLYFNVSLNGKIFNFCVESDEFGVDTDVYKAVEALQVGQKLDLEAFMYWYNAPNCHISKVTVK